MTQDFSKLPSLQDSAAMSREDFDKAHGRWVDNPGPEWVNRKLQAGEKVPSSGFNTAVNMPTSWLMGLKGNAKEHEWQTLDHPQVQNVAKNVRENGLQYAPHIEVHHKNAPTIYEGNKRIRAQHINGQEATPVNFGLLNGAEDYFHPHDIIKSYVDKQNRDKKIQDLLDRHKNLSSNRTAAKVDKLEPVKREQAKDKKWLWQHPGRPTARIDKLVSLPVAWLKTLPGLRGEHKKLTKDMPKVKALAELVKDRSWQRENPITLGVQHDGKVFIDDGNHRVLGAQISKIDTLLCRIKYFGGGENKLDLNKIIEKYADSISELLTKTARDYSKNIGYYQKGKTRRCYGAGLGNEGCQGIASGGGLFCDPCRNNPNRKKRDPSTPPPSPDSMYVDKHTQQQIWNADPRNKKASPDILNHIMELTNSGVDWGKVMEQAVVNKPLISGTVNQVKAKIPKFKSPKQEQEFAEKSVSASLKKWADDQGISGATDLDGGPGDQEFDEQATRGADYAGANDPNKGDEPIFNKSHPNENEDKPQNDIKVAAVEPYYEWNHSKVPRDAQTIPLESIYPGKSPIPMSPATQMNYVKPTSNDEVINTLDTPGPEMTERRPSQGKGPDDDVELLEPHLPVSKQYVKNEMPEGMHSETRIEPRVQPNDFTKVKRMYDNHVGTEGLPFSLNHLRELVPFARHIIEAKLSEKDSDMLEGASLDNEGYAEAKHHLDTNMGQDCKDNNCPYHLPIKTQASEEKHRFTDKEHRQHDHIKDSEEERGMSEEEADDVAWATVNKQKHEAFLKAAAALSLLVVADNDWQKYLSPELKKKYLDSLNDNKSKGLFGGPLTLEDRPQKATAPPGRGLNDLAKTIRDNMPSIPSPQKQQTPEFNVPPIEKKKYPTDWDYNEPYKGYSEAPAEIRQFMRPPRGDQKDNMVDDDYFTKKHPLNVWPMHTPESTEEPRPGQKMHPDTMGPYGWGAPDGSFHHVKSFGNHYDGERGLKEQGLIPMNDNGSYVDKHYVHYSPGHTRLPENLTHEHVNTLADYVNKVNQKAKGFEHIDSERKNNLNRLLEEALAKRDKNDLNNVFNMNQAKKKALDYILKLANKVLLASSNKPCVTCGMPSDSCVCLSDTNISPGYTQSGTQRKNQAPKVKSHLPPGMDPSKGQQHM